MEAGRSLWAARETGLKCYVGREEGRSRRKEGKLSNDQGLSYE